MGLRLLKFGLPSSESLLLPPPEVLELKRSSLLRESRLSDPLSVLLALPDFAEELSPPVAEELLLEVAFPTLLFVVSFVLLEDCREEFFPEFLLWFLESENFLDLPFPVGGRLDNNGKALEELVPLAPSSFEHFSEFSLPVLAFDPDFISGWDLRP